MKRLLLLSLILSALGAVATAPFLDVYITKSGVCKPPAR